MELVELHTLAKEKSIFNAFILARIKYRREPFKKNDIFIIAAKDVYLVNQGTLFQMNLLREHFLYNYISPQDFIVKINPEKKLKFMAVEDGEMIIFAKKEMYEFLEQEQLLSNFFLTLLEKSYSVIDYLNIASTFSAEDKVKYVLYCSLKHVEVEPVEGFLPLPTWVTKKTIAQISQCSVSIVSKILRKLTNEQLLKMNDVIWYKHTRL